MSMTRHDYRTVCDGLASAVALSGIDDTIQIARLLSTMMERLSANANFNQEYFARFFWDRLMAYEAATKAV